MSAAPDLDARRRRLHRTARLLIWVMERFNGGWSGACHALSAVGYVLLREQGLPAMACIGEARIGKHVVNHSWIEVDGLPFDIAIADQINLTSFAPVVAGKHTDDGRPCEIQYGVVSFGLDEEREGILGKSIADYMSAFAERKNGLWSIVLLLGPDLDLSLDLATLQSKYADDRWVLRASPLP